MRPVVGTLAETRTAIAMMRLLVPENAEGVENARAALRAAVQDQGVRMETVALLLGIYAVIRSQSVGFDIDFWASIAIAAAEDWEHEPTPQGGDAA